MGVDRGGVLDGDEVAGVRAGDFEGVGGLVAAAATVTRECFYRRGRRENVAAGDR